MTYTLQKDFGKYGARWGCSATVMLNICEHELKKKFTHNELLTLTGRWFETQSVYIANYHNHNPLLDRGRNWDEKNDPEWHFLVGNIDNAIKDCFYVKGREATTKRAQYFLCKYKTPYGNHYCLSVNGIVINPDPDIPVDFTGLLEKERIEL